MSIIKTHSSSPVLILVDLIEEITEEIGEILFRMHSKRVTLLSCTALNIDRQMPSKELFTPSWVIELSNIHFFQLFRMERQTYHCLINAVQKVDKDKIVSRPYKGGHHPVNIDVHILVFLWYMATPDSLISIGTQFKISAPTVMKIVNKVLYLVLQMKNTYIKFPKTCEELEDISKGFKSYPGVVGALDGTHIFMKAQKDQYDSYIDRYRRTSIILMGICDSNTLFTYVFIGYPGSAHDSRVFDNSLLNRDIIKYGPDQYFKNKNFHLIADSAFTIRTWLLTPYRGDKLTSIQKKHNICLSSDRVVIEHCFGSLKGRWRRLQYINTYNVCKTIEITSAACVLHNFCLLKKDNWNEEFMENESVVGNNDNLVHQNQQDRRENREAKLKRDTIAINLFNNIPHH